MRIKVEAAKKSSLCNVYTEQGFAFSISAKGIVETGLPTSGETDGQTFEKAREYAAREKIFERAVYYLGFRDYSAKELRDRLARAGMDGSEAVERLKELGYIDDARYADKLIERYGQKLGRRGLEAELRRHGLDRALCAQKLAQLPQDDPSSLAEQVRLRMHGSPFEDRKQRERVYAYFLRRGYAHEDIKRAIELYNESIGESL